MKNNVMLGKLYAAREAINTVKNILGGLIISCETMNKLDNEIETKEMQLRELKRKIEEIKQGIETSGINYSGSDWIKIKGTFYIDSRQEKVMLKMNDVSKVFCLNKFYIDYHNQYCDYRKV